MSLTLVTMLFDINRRNKVPRRSIKEYLEWGKTVLELNQDMVIYCDIELADEIKKLRNPNARTEIIAAPFEGLPQYKWIWYVRQGKQPNNNMIDADILPNYIVMGWSKPQILCDVALRAILLILPMWAS